MKTDVQNLTEAYNKLLEDEQKSTNIMDILSAIGKTVGEVKEIRSMSDGMFAFIDFKDGQTYEIQIRPLRYGHYKKFHQDADTTIG